MRVSIYESLNPLSVFGLTAMHCFILLGEGEEPRAQRGPRVLQAQRDPRDLAAEPVEPVEPVE